MSVDEKVTAELVETLRDGEAGYERAADRLRDEDATLAQTLRDLSAQRAGFAAELQTMAAAYGDHVDEDGTVAGALHRGWIALKDAVTGNDTSAVLKAVVTGEDHAISEYEKALEEDISADLRQVAERQLADIRAARDRIDGSSRR